jgi:type II secretory pathway component PulK
MGRRSHNYGHHSRVHRSQTRRRKVKRAGHLLWLMGWLLIVAHLIFLVSGLLTQYAEREARIKLAFVYLGAGVVCLLGAWLIDRTSWRSRSRRHSRMAEDDGSVLILVLIMLALVGGIVLETQIAARGAHRLESSRLREQLLRHAASSAVLDAMRRLADDEDLTVDHAWEPWAQPDARLLPDGTRVDVIVRDENRWFDVNNLSLPDRDDRRSPRIVLRDILTLCGDLTPASAVQALGDWVDADDRGLLESFHYRERDPSYAAPNRVLYGWAEWLRVEGWSRADFDPRPRVETAGPFQGSLVDTVTAVPVPRVSPVPVNLNTASPDTLRGVLGLEQEALVRELVARRKAAPLRRLDAAALAVDTATLQPLLPYLAVRSAYFRIEAEATQGVHRERIRVLARREPGGTVEVLQWLR